MTHALFLTISKIRHSLEKNGIMLRNMLRLYLLNPVSKSRIKRVSYHFEEK